MVTTRWHMKIVTEPISVVSMSSSIALHCPRQPNILQSAFGWNNLHHHAVLLQGATSDCASSLNARTWSRGLFLKLRATAAAVPFPLGTSSTSKNFLPATCLVALLNLAWNSEATCKTRQHHGRHTETGHVLASNVKWWKSTSPTQHKIIVTPFYTARAKVNESRAAQTRVFFYCKW